MLYKKIASEHYKTLQFSGILKYLEILYVNGSKQPPKHNS